MDKKRRAKKYCAAYNCLNTDFDSNLTFFKLPNNDERYRTWLKLINRQDLLRKQDLNRASYYVCSQHFHESSFKIIKHLKDDALPLIFLQPQEGSCFSQQPSSSTEINIKLYVTNETQTEQKQSSEEHTQTESKETSEKQTQTSPTARKPTRKLFDDSKRRKLDEELKEIKKELQKI